MSSLSQGSATLGIVISLEDEEGAEVNKDKVKVRIPSEHGPLKKEDLPEEWSKTSYWVEDKDLPWIPICYPLGTSSPNKNLLKEKEIVYILYTGPGRSAPVIVGTAAILVKE